MLVSPADVWIPLAMDPANTRVNHGRFLMAIARMRPDAKLAQVRAEMDTIGDRLEHADPDLNHGWRPSVYSLREELSGDVEKPLEVLSGAVGFLLLMACVNVANLLLARGNSRRREIAIRLAIGATRGRIATQLLSESLLLSLTGGALGLLLAWGGIALVAHLGPASMPRLAEARLDWRLFLFALCISVATGLIFGLAPAIQGSDARPYGVLIEAGRGRTAGRSARLLRNALVVAEIGLAVLVLIGATLLIRSFVRLRGERSGFSAGRAFSPCGSRWRARATPLRYAGLPSCNRRRSAWRHCRERARSPRSTLCRSAASDSPRHSRWRASRR